MREKILCIIQGIKDISIEDSKINYRLLEDFNMDSIEIMEMVVEIENVFGVEFSLDELDLDFLSTVESVENMVKILLDTNE